MSSIHFRQSEVACAGLIGGMHIGDGAALEPEPPRNLHFLRTAIAEFPHRPDADIISETIPLFYIGQDHSGLWVARESEGRSGGLFWSKQSALRFARKKSEPAGCATMFLNEPFELDIENRGSRIAAPIAAGVNAVARRAPALVACVVATRARWRELIARVSRALPFGRKLRRPIKTDLFDRRYPRQSKSGGVTSIS
jgi:hypothetical protein